MKEETGKKIRAPQCSVTRKKNLEFFISILILSQESTYVFTMDLFETRDFITCVMALYKDRVPTGQRLVRLENNQITFYDNDGSVFLKLPDNYCNDSLYRIVLAVTCLEDKIPPCHFKDCWGDCTGYDSDHHYVDDTYDSDHHYVDDTYDSVLESQ